MTMNSIYRENNVEWLRHAARWRRMAARRLDDRGKFQDRVERAKECIAKARKAREGMGRMAGMMVL